MSVPQTKCEDAAISFQLTLSGSNTRSGRLEVWDVSGSKKAHGSTTFPSDWFQWVSAFEVGSQALYIGPASFSIVDVQYG